MPRTASEGESHAYRLQRRHGGCRRAGQTKRGKANETERMTEAEKPQRNPDVKQTNWDCMLENKASAPAPHAHTPTLMHTDRLTHTV